MNSNCSNLLDLRNLQEKKLKKHSVTKTCSDFSLFEQIVLVISKFLQILSLQPRIPKVFLHHYIERFFLTLGQNYLGNKIPFLTSLECVYVCGKNTYANSKKLILVTSELWHDFYTMYWCEMWMYYVMKKIIQSIKIFYLTEAGTYPKLPTQPKFFWSFSNLYSNLLWSFWVVLRRKIKIRMRRKKVQFITKKGSLQAFLPWKRNFQ